MSSVYLTKRLESVRERLRTARPSRRVSARLVRSVRQSLAFEGHDATESEIRSAAERVLREPAPVS